jgi:hypothetical protein
MWRRFFDPFAICACYVPMFIVLAGVVLLVVLPLFQVPSVEKMARYARKLIRGRPDASTDELRRTLRARFLPDWATDKPPETNVFIYGIAGSALLHMIRGMRSYLFLQVMESRIHRAIEIADSD